MAKFVTTQLQGGIGNAFFQIATVLGYAQKHNLTPILPDWKYRNIYSIPESFFLQYEKGYGNYSKTVYSEPHFHHAEIPQFEADIVELQGYYQSWKYFEDVENLVKQFFEPKLHLQVEVDDRYWKIVGTTSEIVVGIHFRAGDYKRFPAHHPLLNANYYINSLLILKQKYPKQKLKVLWFSDEMSLVKHMINNSALRQLVDQYSSFQFIEGQTDWQDLYMLSKCDSMVIGNSTFSYWSAYLSKNVENVLYPQKNRWFGSALRGHQMFDLFLPKWEEVLF